MPDPLLFLSAHLPVERSRQAGHKTAWRNLCWLAERHPVHLIAFRAEGDRDESLAPLRKVCARLEIIDVSRINRLTGLLARPNLPLVVAARSCQRVSSIVTEWSRNSQYCRVHFEWSQMVQYAALLSMDLVRTLYVHDVLSQWASRKSKGVVGLFWHLEALRTRAWEHKAYLSCTRLYVPSEKDKSLIAVLDSDLNGRCSVLPLHIDFYRPLRPRSYDGPIRILFWGALGRPENAEAARWLCTQVLPRLRASKTSFTMIIAGSNPPADILTHRGFDCVVTGFVEDPAEEFGRSHIALAPLFQGAGVKVKVLECLSAGLPVLTTAIGSEGIEAREDQGLLTLPENPDAFVSMINQLAADRSNLARLGLSALEWGRGYQKDSRSTLFF